MKLIGGELPIKLIPCSVIFTDSGRSSLRLILRQKQIRNKIIAIPDFICDIVPQVLENEGTKFVIYHINENLDICYKDLDRLEYDILYIVGYFGIRYYIPSKYLDNKILIDDNVFFYDFFNHNDAKFWVGFNSYRKISHLADGSLILTNMDFDTKDIICENAPYSMSKYKAKHMKHNYLLEIERELNKEKEYLDLLSLGEKQLDEQKGIYTISYNSIYNLSKYDYINSKEIQRKRFFELLDVFKEYCINSKAEEYTFFVLKIDNREEIIQSLRKKEIYLPIHWPYRGQSPIPNILYQKVLSIPLFSFYSDEEFNFLKESLIEVIY